MRFSAIVLILPLAGCVPKDFYYEENAVKELGTVIAKTDLSIGQPKACGSDLIFVQGVGAFPVGSPTCTTYPHAYQVRLNDGREFEVQSMHSGFEEGQCVFVFIGPTRMQLAHGSGC